MTDKKTIEKFEEMFDLTSSNDDQVEEYGSSTKSDESFDDLSKELQQEIGDLSDKGEVMKKETPHDIIMDVASKKPEEVVILKEHECVSSYALDIVDDDFDELPEQEVSKKKVEKVVELEGAVVDLIKAGEELKNEISKKDIEKKIEIEEIVKTKIQTAGDKIQWSLNSSSTMFDNFYEQKRIFLNSYMIGGEIEYTRWTRELEEAQVDVITEVFDQQVIINQMERIQQYRNRVKYIGVRVNNQYFLFDRFIVLLRGYLARIQYIKPVLKQDGLILEHMGDIELYFGRLKALHKSVADTEKNLAAAYEMLSRKVTICMELPPVERYEKKQANPYKSKFSSPVPEKDSGDYDELPVNAKAGVKEQKLGSVGWGEL